MVKALINIVKKEIKEILRDPRLFLGMILVPLIMFPALGFGMRAVIESSIKQTQTTTIAVLNLDRGEMAEQIFKNSNLIAVLEQNNISIIYLNDHDISSKNEAINYLIRNESISALLVVPENFSECISNQTPATIQVYTVLRSFSFEGAAGSSRVNIAIGIIKQLLANYLIISMDPNADPVFITNPIVPFPVTIYKDKEIRGVPPELITGLMFSQIFMLPLSVMFLLMIAVQFAAISVASEKEQKTLETLLSLPVKRTTILAGKLTGSILISIVGAVGYIAGFGFYMSSIMPAEELPISMEELAELGLMIPMEGYILLGITVFLSLLACLSMAVVLAAFAEDVRSAQALLSFLFIPMVILGFVAIFMTMGGVGEEFVIALLFVPFTNPMVAGIQIFNGKYLLVILGILVISIETIGFIYIAAWFYSSEKVLVARLRFGKKSVEKELEIEEIIVEQQT